MHNKSEFFSDKKSVLGGCHGRFFNFTYTQLLIINVILIYAFMNGRWRTSHKFTLEKQKRKKNFFLFFSSLPPYTVHILRFIFTLCFSFLPWFKQFPPQRHQCCLIRLLYSGFKIESENYSFIVLELAYVQDLSMFFFYWKACLNRI